MFLQNSSQTPSYTANIFICHAWKKGKGQNRATNPIRYRGVFSGIAQLLVKRKSGN
jgi:hypothetical protein